jgi:hypothetical protein
MREAGAPLEASSVHSVRLSRKLSKLIYSSHSCSTIRRSPRLSGMPLHEIASYATAPTRCAAPIRVPQLERAGELIDPSKRPASSFRSPGQGEDQKAFNPLEIMHAGYTYS